MPVKLPEQAKACLKRLTDQGYKAFIVGGLVRNILLGKVSPTDDIDIVTNAR
jgi:tRNA nucleotidyltransferase/poly(A) polymerase